MSTDTDNTVKTNNTQADLELKEQPDGSLIVVDPSDVAPAGTTEDPDDLGEEASTLVSGRGEADPDDGPTEAEELRMATDEAAREAIRARRRKERKERKLAAHQREQGLRDQLAQTQRSLAEVQEQVNLVNRKTSGAELAQLDQAIRDGQQAVEFFTNALATAASTNNGVAQAEAINKLLLSRERVKELGSIRQQIATPRQQAPALDPDLVRHAQTWMGKNAWYDPRGRDDDSRIVLALDASLVQEGVAPNTPAYWEALDKKVAKHLPHRVGAATGRQNGDILPNADARKPGRSVVTGSGREAAASSRGREFTLSAERVQALKDAGMWNDSTQRADMIRRYRELDRQAEAGKS